MKIIIILIVSGTGIINAAFEKIESGAIALAMGNAFVAVPLSPTAIFDNPAALDTGTTLTAHFSARTFNGYPGVSQVDLVLGCRLVPPATAWSISRFGNEHYQEIQVGAAYALNFSGDFFIGISIQSYFLSILGYGSDSSLGLNAGMLYHIDHTLYCGAMITNINQPSIGERREDLPQTFSLGICYFPEEQLILTAEIFHDIRFEPDYRIGASYEFEYPIIIRFGFQDAVNSYSLGVGVHWETFFIDYALQMHQILDESHILSITIRL